MSADRRVKTAPRAPAGKPSKVGAPKSLSVKGRTTSAARKAAPKAAAKVTAKTPAKAASKTASRSAAKPAARVPAKTAAKAPAKASSKVPAKTAAKAPAKTAAKASAKSPAKAPAKSAAKASAKSAAKAPPKSTAKAPAKSAAKAPPKSAAKAFAKTAAKPKARAPMSAEAKARLEAVKAAALRAKARRAKKSAAKPAPARAPEPEASIESPPAPPPVAPRARRRVAPWAPRPIPLHPLEGRPQDPRLAAALAARERWHGRSGRPALKSATQAIAFARERHLVHPVVQSALPNLVDPLIGRACTAEERASGPLWSTLEGWLPEIERAPDLLTARLCFERPTLARAELWPSLAAVAAPREEAARGGGVLTLEAEDALELLDRRGELTADRLARLLDLSTVDFAKVQGELESQLVVLSRPDVDEDDQPVCVLEPTGRWAERVLAQRRFEVELQRAWTFLFIAALRAAVVLWPEEIEALYPWSAAEREAAIAEAMSTGGVVTYQEGDSMAYVASPVPR
ncbi:MAG TPA: hypothetical protein VN033_12205 [Vulgatibacter sp.]|nr:hypothetical protein [Vulgatibacter sp.]